MRHGLLAGVVGGEREREVVREPIDETPQVPHAPVDVLARVERVPHTEHRGGLGISCMSPRAPFGETARGLNAGLGADDRRHEPLRHAVAVRGLGDLA